MQYGYGTFLMSSPTKLMDHTNGINDIAYTPDGQTIASGSGDETIKLWRIADGTLSRILEGHAGSVSSVAFAPDGQTLASGSFDNTIRLWRIADGTLSRILEGHAGSVSSVAFAPDGRTTLQAET